VSFVISFLDYLTYSEFTKKDVVLKSAITFPTVHQFTTWPHYSMYPTKMFCTFLFFFYSKYSLHFSHFIHSFRSLPYDRSTVSSKASYPHSAIYCFLFPLVSLRSSSSCLILHPGRLVTSVLTSNFPSITSFRKQFLRKI